MKKETKIVLLFLFLTIQLLAIGIVLVNYLFFTNTLANNNKWQVGKTQLFNPGYDGTTFRDFLPALAKNSLNLSAWRGYHEVSSTELVDWNEFSLRFLPSRNSYLYIVFNKTDKYFSALRISYSPFYENALITAKYDGEFIEQIPLRNQVLDGDGWQKIDFKRDDSDSRIIKIFYKENLFATYHSEDGFPTGGKIGFRSGRNQILVDDVMAIGKDGQILIKENFDHLDNFFTIFFNWSFFIFCFDFILLFIFKNKENYFKSLVKINFAICNMLILIGLFLLLLGPTIRNRYPKHDPGSGKSIINLSKSINDAQGSSWLQYKSMDLISKHSSSVANSHVADSSIYKIMVVGSSQTAGEGSALEGEDFVSQFSHLIDNNLSKSSKKFEVINAGLSGESSKSILDYFKYQWLQLKPNLVILNVSSNDESYNTGFDFPIALENFISLSKKYDFKLVFVAEANSVETKAILQNHKIMREIAEKNQITFIDMHDYLSDQQNSGIIWWDFVHPTSFGYKLIAQHLFDSLETELIK